MTKGKTTENPTETTWAQGLEARCGWTGRRQVGERRVVQRQVEAGGVVQRQVEARQVEGRRGPEPQPRGTQRGGGRGLSLWLVSVGLGLALLGAGSCKRHEPQEQQKAPQKSIGGKRAIQPGSPLDPVSETREESGKRLLQGKIGIPICDEYLSRYAACIAEKVPQATRPKMKQGLAATRKAWRRALRSPGGRSRLTTACEMAVTSAKQAMAVFGCQW